MRLGLFLLVAAGLTVVAAGCTSPSVNQSGESTQPHDTGTGSGVNCVENTTGQGEDAGPSNATGSDAFCTNATVGPTR